MRATLSNSSAAAELMMALLTCDDVPDDLTVSHAHQLIQEHLDCPRHCRRRRAALTVLEDEGHYRMAYRFG